MDFFALSTGNAPRALGASEILEGLTPDDVCEAVEGVRFSLTDEESREAVARIVRRRQRASVRVREEEETYSPVPEDSKRDGVASRSHGALVR